MKTTGVFLSCEGAKAVADFEAECCATCHDLTQRNTHHSLHTTMSPKLQKNGGPAEAYVCCHVERALHRRKVPIGKQGTAGNQGSGVWVEDSKGIVYTSNTIEVNENPMVVEATFHQVGQVAEELEKQNKLLAESIQKLTPKPEGFWVHKAVPELAHEQHIPHCTDPKCLNCLYADRYWSYKLQGWVRLSDFAELNQQFKLELMHPVATGSHHSCCPATFRHNKDGTTYIDEYAAWLCHMSDGLPTFGVNYSCNPQWCAVIQQHSGPPQIVLNIPEGEKVTDWIVPKWAAHVTQIQYLSPNEGPPF